MAKPTRLLIDSIRSTASSLEDPEVTYKWSNFAHCNCGHLVRTVTGLESGAIQQRAMLHERDWGKQAQAHAQKPEKVQFTQPDYGDDRPPLDEGAWEPENVGACTLTGMSLDVVFDKLGGIGLETVDFQHLERLSDPIVRKRLGTSHINYPHNDRQNVIDYLRAWADLLEEEFSDSAATPMGCAIKWVPVFGDCSSVE